MQFEKFLIVSFLRAITLFALLSLNSCGGSSQPQSYGGGQISRVANADQSEPPPPVFTYVDADVQALRTRLTALPKRDPIILEENRALEKAFFVYQHITNVNRKRLLIASAHKRLATRICFGQQCPDPDIWRYGGYTALAENNANWAMFAWVRLPLICKDAPQYLVLPQTSELLTQLQMLPYVGNSEGAGGWLADETRTAQFWKTASQTTKSFFGPTLDAERVIDGMERGNGPFDLTLLLSLYDKVLQAEDATRLDRKTRAEEIGEIYCFGIFGAPVDFSKALEYFEIMRSYQDHPSGAASYAADMWLAGTFDIEPMILSRAHPSLRSSKLVKDSAMSKRWLEKSAEWSSQ